MRIALELIDLAAKVDVGLVAAQHGQRGDLFKGQRQFVLRALVHHHAVAVEGEVCPGTEGDLVAIGEVGLTGELRSVNFLGQRLSEVRRLGFTKCIVPSRSSGKLVVPDGLDLIRVNNIREALAAIL